MAQVPASGEASSALSPVLPEERIVLLDVLRGFALLGILIMNMEVFNTAWSSFALEPRPFQGAVDRAAQFAMDALVAGKANSIFSFLFGLGLTIQMERAAARGQKVAPMYLRRIAVLFVIGAVHALLIWSGDVLHIYAVLGLLLLLVRRAPDRLVFALIAFFMVAPVVRSTWGLYHREASPHQLPYYADLAREHMRIFQQGSYAEQVAARVADYKESYGEARNLRGAMWAYAIFSVTILLGLYAGRKRVLEDVPGNAPWIRRVVGWCFGLGGAAAIGLATASLLHKPAGHATLTGFLTGLCYDLNRPLLCIAYIGAIALLFQKDRWRRLFMPLASVGRMPLTNYLMQSIIATTIFYSHGFGLFGKVGPALGLLITAVIFAVQVVYSNLWMARFRFGPLEWLWRGATYGKFPPLRIEPRREAATA